MPVVSQKRGFAGTRISRAKNPINWSMTRRIFQVKVQCHIIDLHWFAHFLPHDRPAYRPIMGKIIEEVKMWTLVNCGPTLDRLWLLRSSKNSIFVHCAFDRKQKQDLIINPTLICSLVFKIHIDLVVCRWNGLCVCARKSPRHLRCGKMSTKRNRFWLIRKRATTSAIKNIETSLKIKILFFQNQTIKWERKDL